LLSCIVYRNYAKYLAKKHPSILTCSRYQWPVNVRELENLVDRLVVLKGQGMIEPEDFPEKMCMVWTPGSLTPPIQISDEGFYLDTAMGEFERDLILKALEKADGI
jgi:DNA-binding NtrC family response regulator